MFSKTGRICLAMLALMLLAGTVQAQDEELFSVNFYAYGKGGATYWDQEAWRETVRIDTTDLDQSAGVWETVDWQNLGSTSGTLTSDNAATATFTINNKRNESPHHWTTTRDTANDLDQANASMLDAKIVGTEYDAANGTGSPFPAKVLDFTVTDIPFETYDLILYFGVNDGQKYAGLGNVRINEQIPVDPTDQTGGWTFTMLETPEGAKYEPNGTLDQITEDGDTGNYILFEGLTGDFQAQVWGDNFTHLGVAGMQIKDAEMTLEGDANLDGVVDAADYILIKQNMGLPVGVAGEDGDIDGDGTVDFDDLQSLIIGMGGAGQSPAIPEPASLFVLLAAGLPAVLKRRQGRS